MAAKKPPQEPAQGTAYPQMSFSEEDVKKIRDYLNFIGENAEFCLKPPGIAKFMQLTAFMVDHAKKCERHIFEVREIIKAQK